ncbi:LON peptidase substrate-binding domain-containing protein [Pseudidiomarina sp.]|uniref:LON peptidase substrate-binding domain-containing protein n=1 Tax=Pseudidiomarina sp. TaxID=2081707 RepID=UPI00299E180A|nr:LON peptidase substrate-binding domain-containing protein [Pseudidiomarina sp.]MDX1705548.1 LON peptidase substrate-binding domain-containing protein [Pseudidiomarina sp.]
MSAEPVKVPLFPLAGHILPGGKMRLRIFEPRYVRMVREACGQSPTAPIGICMLNEEGNSADNTHIHKFGTLCRIIDFDALPDSMLGITIAGEQLFAIDAIETAADGLRSGTVQLVEHWPATELAPDDSVLAEHLKAVYSSYPELEVCPDEECLSRADWICQRWLELLPVSADIKQELLAQSDCQEALNYLHELVAQSRE